MISKKEIMMRISILEEIVSRQEEDILDLSKQIAKLSKPKTTKKINK